MHPAESCFQQLDHAEAEAEAEAEQLQTLWLCQKQHWDTVPRASQLASNWTAPALL